MAQTSNTTVHLLSTSIGRKVLMALSGLFLITFLPVHLAGNLLLFKSDGGAAFNAYSQFMSTSLLIRILEVTLVVGFLVHIIDGIILTRRNKAARPIGYSGGKSYVTSFFSRSMAATGLIILIYLVIHINSYTLKHRIYEPGNLAFYETVKESFETGWAGFYPWFYVLAMLLISIHLNHGFQSAFQSLGLNHKKYTPWIKKLGLLYSIVIPLGFAAIPIFFQLKYFNII
ncbi:MAG: hypothetical protein LDLANPLL_01388 [Turneriella sp.]|nr:hypothetical protein [Turneriella sp.]